MAQAAEIGFWGQFANIDAGRAEQPGDSWERAHDELVRLAKKRAGLDVEEGRWLLRAFRAGAHVRLGYGSFNEYVERLFGYGPRLTQELRIEGTPSRGLTFRHADGTLYGAPPAAGSVDLRAKAHRALTQLGYRESETKQALARLPATADFPLKDLILLALRELS
jgi:hypothetical protein